MAWLSSPRPIMTTVMIRVGAVAYGGLRGADDGGTTAGAETPGDALDARHGANLA